jgi:threonine/homoserine/homoserine lactone efflux protein
MKRLWTALGLFAVLAVLAWTTISDQKFRLATVAVLAFFALRTWTWSRKQEREQHEREERDRSDE